MGVDERVPSTPWFRVVRSCPDPRIRVVCYPHAGGAASFFRSWLELLPTGVELLAVRYPGREDRILEPAAETMEQLAGPIARACAELRGAPLAFFGHSMGAAVAYEVVRRLPARQGVVVAGLFVSGRSGPDAVKPNNLADGADAELVESLVSMGGTDARTLERPELLDILLPVFRADCRLTERYDRDRAARPPTAADALTVPVTAYYGDTDPDVDERSVAAWAAVTRSSFSVRSFSGGHFYVIDHVRTLVEDIIARVLAHRVTA